MAEANVSAMRDPETAFRDIENIEQATGITLPFGWIDVITNALLGPIFAGVCFFAAVLMRDDRTLLTLNTLVAVIFIIVFTTMLVAARIWYRRSTGRSATRRRESSLGLIAGAVVFTMAVPYCVYLFALGIPLAALLGQGLFFLGLLASVLAFSAPGRLPYLGSAIPMMIAGVTFPAFSSSGSAFNFVPFSMLDTTRMLFFHNAFICLVAGFLTAAIMTAQLLLSRNR
jgi:hypothetical protein